jgi:hypothetical protein
VQRRDESATGCTKLTPVYLLARRTASSALLTPHAAFVQLVGDYVLIQVPLREADAQQARLRNRGAGGEVRYGTWVDAEKAALGGSPLLLSAATLTTPAAAPALRATSRTMAPDEPDTPGDASRTTTK